MLSTCQFAEAFNKMIGMLLKKFISQSQCKDDKVGNSLWAYRTTMRTRAKATPFFLVYGCEAILTLEIQISSLGVSLTTKMTDEVKHKLRLEELEKLSGKSLKEASNRALPSTHLCDL